MLSAICLNLDQSKILLSGNGLIPFVITKTLSDNDDETDNDKVF